MATQMKTRSGLYPLSWTPGRRGWIYCSPACGGDCTWRQFLEATRKAKRLARRLGKSWKPSVWENLGWHYQATCGFSSVREYSSNDYAADIQVGRQFIAKGVTPKGALVAAIRVCDQSMKEWKKQRIAFDIAQQGGR